MTNDLQTNLPEWQFAKKVPLTTLCKKNCPEQQFVIEDKWPMIYKQVVWNDSLQKKKLSSMTIDKT